MNVWGLVQPFVCFSCAWEWFMNVFNILWNTCFKVNLSFIYSTLYLSTTQHSILYSTFSVHILPQLDIGITEKSIWILFFGKRMIFKINMSTINFPNIYAKNRSATWVLERVGRCGIQLHKSNKIIIKCWLFHCQYETSTPSLKTWQHVQIPHAFSGYLIWHLKIVRNIWLLYARYPILYVQHLCGENGTKRTVGRPTMLLRNYSASVWMGNGS